MMLLPDVSKLQPEQYKKLRDIVDRRSDGRGGRGGARVIASHSSDYEFRRLALLARVTPPSTGVKEQ